MFVWLASVAAAEDSAFSTAQAETAEKPESKVTGELGATWASGNTNFYAVNGLVTASHKWKKNKLSGVAGVNLGAAISDVDGNGYVDDADGGYVENAQRFYGDARYDRFLSDKDSLYVLAGAFRDKFAGFELRSHEQIGYSRLLLKNESSELRTELGADWAQENYTEVDVLDPVSGAVIGREDPDTQQIIAARVLIAASHAFNESVGLADVLEVYENVIDPEDLRLLNTATVTSALSGKFSIKLSHTLIFDNVPVENFRKLDQTTMVTLVASLI
jgi:putative salt-induced outer membrane protein YdiY